MPGRSSASVRICVHLWTNLLLGLSFVAGASAQESILLRPAAVFDGQELHQSWVVLVTGDRIAAAGPGAEITAPAGTHTIDLPGQTLMPGMIEGHSHMFLHPYNETSWNEQVTNESLALRTARATVHARKTLEAGFTTARDLGTEGAGYADVGLKQAIDAGHHPGTAIDRRHPRNRCDRKLRSEIIELIVDVPQGAQECSGVEECIRVTREQIGKGADCGEGLCRLPLGKWRAVAADIFAGRTERDCANRALRRPSDGRARDHARRHAPRDQRRRGNDRAWR